MVPFPIICLGTHHLQTLRDTRSVCPMWLTIHQDAFLHLVGKLCYLLSVQWFFVFWLSDKYKSAFLLIPGCLCLCSFDHSWRLWDLEQLKEVLHQVFKTAPFTPFPSDWSFDNGYLMVCECFYCRRVTLERCTVLHFRLMAHLQPHGMVYHYLSSC